MEESDKRRLKELLVEHALSYGDFVLSSGKKSPYYLDVRKVSTLPEGAFLLAKILLSMLGEGEIQALGGPTIGADPIAGAVAAVSFFEGRPLPTFLVRKEVKVHGTGRAIEGNLENGWKVAIVDDVVTTANSILSAARTVEETGCVVVRTLAVVDREEGGAEEIRSAGYPFDAILRVSEILDAGASATKRPGKPLA
ncbi:MAG: orotate phosphoribosyltransferase [Candidatus Eisenbacteria bacterium]|nr:orotate phosphoribosyltransferase [Candidatus Eisenbacteria bacterium]